MPSDSRKKNDLPVVSETNAPYVTEGYAQPDNNGGVIIFFVREYSFKVNQLIITDGL